MNYDEITDIIIIDDGEKCWGIYKDIFFSVYMDCGFYNHAAWHVPEEKKGNYWSELPPEHSLPTPYDFLKLYGAIEPAESPDRNISFRPVDRDKATWVGYTKFVRIEAGDDGQPRWQFVKG